MVTWSSENLTEWSAIAGTAIASLLIAWKRYRNKRKNGGYEMIETCPAHQAVKERLEWGNDRFKSLEGDMQQVKTGIAVIVERLENMKLQVIENREIVNRQYQSLIDTMHEIKGKVDSA